MQSTNKDARHDAPHFDLMVIGGGIFSGTLGQFLLCNDKTHNHRKLMLEGGASSPENSGKADRIEGQ